MNTFEKYRVREKLTRAQLAETIGVSRAAVYKWESGLSLPSAAKLPELARVLHCTVDDLLKEDA